LHFFLSPLILFWVRVSFFVGVALAQEKIHTKPDGYKVLLVGVPTTANAFSAG
jgi:hypothetical protein